MNPFLGMIAIFGFDWAPRGWALCNGQLLPIAQNQALFALLGTTYGGNGTTNFALPDLRSRCAINFGQGNGLSYYDLGQSSGLQFQTLSVTTMPPHTHALNAYSEVGDASSPANAIPANTGQFDKEYKLAPLANALTPTNAATMNPTGTSQSFSIMQPYLVINYSIALQGIFPSRN